MSAQQTNKFLASKGIIVSWRDLKNRLKWKPTEKGRDFCVLKDVGKEQGDGTPVQQLMYLPSIIQKIGKS